MWQRVDFDTGKILSCSFPVLTLIEIRVSAQAIRYGLPGSQTSLELPHIGFSPWRSNTCVSPLEDHSLDGFGRVF